jgi:hypothetical protein
MFGHTSKSICVIIFGEKLSMRRFNTTALAFTILITGSITGVATSPARAADPIVGTFTCTGGSYKVTDGLMQSEGPTCTGTLVLDVSVTRIDTYTNLGEVTSVTIPATTVTIGQQPFRNEGKLQEIIVDKDNPKYKSIDGVLYSKDGTELIQYPTKKTGTSFAVPNTVTSIVWCAFSSLQYLVNLSLPSSVDSIPSGINTCYWPSFTALAKIDVDSANQKFASIDGVLFDKSISTLISYPRAKPDLSYAVPSTVTEIKDMAGSFFFKNVTLPEGLQTLAQYAYEASASLETVNLPASLYNIVNWPFINSPKLTAINVSEMNKTFKSLDGVLYSKDGTNLIEYPDGKKDPSFLIPEGVTSLQQQWIWGNEFLKEITVTSGVKSIGNGYTRDNGTGRSLVFKGDSGVTSIEGNYGTYINYCGASNSVITAYATSVAATIGCGPLKPIVVKPVVKAPTKTVKKTTIVCVKGKLTKKVTAVKPQCPKGFKKK